MRPVFGVQVPKHSKKPTITKPKSDTSRDTSAQVEGRDFLKIITEVDQDEIDTYQGHAIEAWLYELGYDWNGQSWVYTL